MPIGLQPEITDLDVNKQDASKNLGGGIQNFFFSELMDVRLLCWRDDDFLKTFQTNDESFFRMMT